MDQKYEVGLRSVWGGWGWGSEWNQPNKLSCQLAARPVWSISDSFSLRLTAKIGGYS